MMLYCLIENMFLNHLLLNLFQVLLALCIECGDFLIGLIS